MDSRLIAQFGAVIKPETRPLNSKKVRYIRDLLSRKHQLNEMRTQELNRQHKAPAILAATHKRLIKVLDKEIEGINKLLVMKAFDCGTPNIDCLFPNHLFHKLAGQSYL